MKGLGVLAISAALAFGAVDGVVVNKTTGKPQSNAAVSLYKFGEAGPEPLGSVQTDAEGKFAFRQDVQGMLMLQATYSDVLYTRMLSPGAPSTGIEVEVYESVRQPVTKQVAQHMVLLEPGPQGLAVSETLIINNQGNATLNDPERGTLRFYAPGDIQGGVSVRATAPGSVPLDREAKKTRDPGVYTIDFPIRPGESRIDVTYSLPGGNPLRFAGRVLHEGSPVRLVLPAGVTAKGEGIQLMGEEPRTRASIYGVAGKQYEVTLEGAGSLRGSAGGDEEDTGPGIQQINPRVYESFLPIVGLMSAILLLAFILFYRKGDPAAGPGPVARPAGARKRK